MATLQELSTMWWVSVFRFLLHCFKGKTKHIVGKPPLNSYFCDIVGAKSRNGLINNI